VYWKFSHSEIIKLERRINNCFKNNFTNFLISIAGAAYFLEKSFFSKAISLFIFLYWFTRIIIQFFYFDTRSASQGLLYRLGEWALISLFVFFTAVYGWVVVLNFFNL
jgi:hypothetical protein